MTNFSPKLLITGGNGQLAQALRAQLATHQCYCLAKNALDISDQQQVRQVIANYQPTHVINTAAYTQVDQAEKDKQCAAAVNQLGAENIARVCHDYHLPLIHLSTDYVFSGASHRPYREEDTPQPINYYGFSKWQGELAIQQACQQALILRVSAIFSAYQHNFLKTMCNLAEKQATLRIVSDQITCPTAASAIAKAILSIINQAFVPGIYHFCSTPPVSWYDFANTIIATYQQYRPVAVTRLQAITSTEYNTAATRPPYSVLACQKIYQDYGITQPDWYDGIKEAISTLCGGSQ